jgi:hypothetical protein
MHITASQKSTAIIVGLICVFACTFLITGKTSTAQEATAKASAKLRPEYFPNTEQLRPEEIRITALGTGLPTPITRAQKSTAWMVSGTVLNLHRYQKNNLSREPYN